MNAIKSLTNVSVGMLNEEGTKLGSAALIQSSLL